MTGNRAGILATLAAAGLLTAYGARAETTSAAAPDFAALLRAHREFYLRNKSPERAARAPAMLWHLGSPLTEGGDLAADYHDTLALGQRRDDARLRALAEQAAAAAPRAGALREGALSAMRVALALAERARAGKLTAEALGPLPEADSELGWHLRSAADALGGTPPDVPRAAMALDAAAAACARLADIDRWTELNLRWLVAGEEWLRAEGTAPRTLAYSIQARGIELASLQSRVEDFLWVTDAERVMLSWELARYSGGRPETALPPNTHDALKGLRETVAELRRRDLNLSRELSTLMHARKLEEAQRRTMQDYLPLAAGLEYLAREKALLERATGPTAPQRLADLPGARLLSPAARAALAALERALDPALAARLAPVWESLLRGEYGGAYADLCLYQAAIMETTGSLAQRLRRWAGLERNLTPQGLMEILHPMPGVVSALARPDNAYDPRLFEWAEECNAPTPLQRFAQARDRVNDFYRKHGYNEDQPVTSVRDALDNGLVDCLAACRMHGAVGAAAGVTGIVPVRLWRDRTGHSLVALRTGGELWFLDPLDRKAPTKNPPLGPDAITVEFYAPSFGSHVAEELVILRGNRRLRLDIPYRARPR